LLARQRDELDKEVHERTAELRHEKERSEELLHNILPEEVAEELKAKGSADAQLIEHVTVLFTDFKGFTEMSEKLTAKELVADIHECFSAFDHIMAKARHREDQDHRRCVHGRWWIAHTQHDTCA
jgi:adenylate cyclase